MDSIESILFKFDQQLIDLNSVKDLLQIILHSNDKSFFEGNFLHHRLFVYLRDWYCKLLLQWRHGNPFDENTSYVFENLSNLFLKISNQLTEKNIGNFKEIIFYQPILEQLNKCLEEIASNGKYLQDPQIKSLDNIFRAIQRFERYRIDQKSNLFDNIVQCICSKSFIDIFTQSSSQETEDNGQKFLLHTCTDYIYSHPTDQEHKQSFLQIRQALLQPFSQWLTQQSTSFRLWNTRMSVILRQLCFILTFSIQNNRSIELDRHILDLYCQLIDSFINILYSILQLENFLNNKLAQSLLATITPNLYTMILSKQLEKYLKSKHVTSILLKLIEIDHEEIQLNAFRILSVVLIEQDTKNPMNTTNIIHLFLKSLNKIIEHPSQILRFANLLHCLKNVISFDTIKDEFTKNNGIPLILRCITDTKIQPYQAQQPALEILLALTFHPDAYRQIKPNIHLIKSLSSSPHQGIYLAVDCLLWRLEKQDEHIHQMKSQTYQYDLMISYSHANKDLINQISTQLRQDNFRIWMDHDESIEIPMSHKSNIIDQSQYILICISDEYKQNSYCRSEASYAYQCQYKTIPLILTSNLHPDGWLIEITKGKIYIDFIKLDFELAYNTLKSEINRDQLYSEVLLPISEFDLIPSTKTKIHSYPTTPTPEVNLIVPTTAELAPYVSTSSSELRHWTKEQVKSFLIENHFESLYPIVSEMNGNLLYDLYTMCKESRESMFHTLKNELLLYSSDQPPLTIFVYLKFLQEIQKYHFQ